MNIGRFADDNIIRFGEYDFLCHDGCWHTNVEMNGIANKLGNALKDMGIKKGDRVGVQLLNCPELMQSFFAILKIGATLVPINPSLRVSDLAYIYQDAGLSALVSSSAYLDNIQEARKGAPDLKSVIMVEDSAPGDTLSFNKVIEKASDRLVIEETDNDDTAVMIYTAGTTGNPKGVMLTHFNWYTHVTGYYDLVLLDTWGVTAKGKLYEHEGGQAKSPVTEGEVFGINRNRVSLATLPLFHGYGVFALNSEFITGGKMVMLSRWDPIEAMSAVQKYKVTEFRGVPTMFIQLLNHPDAAKYDLSSLKTCICGSAPMPLEVARSWKQKYGIDIWEGYGLSEATTVNCSNLAGRQPPKYGSVGSCYQKVNSIKIFDENDQALPAGQTGEIVIKGPGVMKGYWNKPKETAEAIRNGWLHTGDIGHIDEDGYVFITDRKKDMIIRGGENIFPREIENILYQHPAVMEAGVIGVPDPVYGEVVKAFVALKSPGEATEEDLMKYCEEQLPKYKRPKSIQLMDALPKSAVGKILRKELRKLN